MSKSAARTATFTLPLHFFMIALYSGTRLIRAQKEQAKVVVLAGCPYIKRLSLIEKGSALFVACARLLLACTFKNLDPKSQHLGL